MITVEWDGKYATLKKLFPIENAVKATEFDSINKTLVFHLSSGDRNVYVGETITRDENGNVS